LPSWKMGIFITSPSIGMMWTGLNWLRGNKKALMQIDLRVGRSLGWKTLVVFVLAYAAYRREVRMLIPNPVCMVAVLVSNLKLILILDFAWIQVPHACQFIFFRRGFREYLDLSSIM